jgi:hypothetical protein
MGDGSKTLRGLMGDKTLNPGMGVKHWEKK